MRVDIAYFEGYPELVTELEKFAPRARAERMRFLAALGLSHLREVRQFRHNQSDNSTQSPPRINQSNPPTDVTLPAARPTTGGGESGMANRITRGIFGQVE
ncbi:MAG: hypothetical protein ACXWTX_02410 [Gallionella sp.]